MENFESRLQQLFDEIANVSNDDRFRYSFNEISVDRAVLDKNLVTSAIISQQPFHPLIRQEYKTPLIC